MNVRSVIQCNDKQYRDILNSCWAAVVDSNSPPYLFVRAGVLVRVVLTNEGAQVEAVNKEAMYGIICEVADFVKVGKAVVACPPPRDIAASMVAAPPASIPPLECISSVPMFLPSGVLWAQDGYCAALKTVFYGLSALGGLPAGAVDQKMVDEAKRFFKEEVFGDFPLAGEAEYASLLAALLLPFVRPLVNGPTPIHLLEAISPGSGKTLLANIITTATTGKALAPISPSDREEEMRKAITSILVGGKPVIVLDNLNKELSSGVLAAAITSEYWQDRILGHTKVVELPNRATWIVTGNNPRLSLEVARRCIRVRITPMAEKPWERTGFHHPDIIQWASENRGLFIRHIYSLVRWWFQHGCPRPACKPLGSFESWTHVIGGILSTAKIEGFLTNCEELYADADPTQIEWEEFVVAWWEQTKGKKLTPGEIVYIADAGQYIPRSLGDGNDKSRTIRMGTALGARRGSYIQGYKINCERDKVKKSTMYWLSVHGQAQQKEVQWPEK